MGRSKNTKAAKRLAKFLRAWRKTNDKTQQEMADLIGVNWHTFQRWESALFMPEAQKVLMICKALNTPLESVYG